SDHFLNTHPLGHFRSSAERYYTGNSIMSTSYMDAVNMKGVFPTGERFSARAGPALAAQILTGGRVGAGRRGRRRGPGRPGGQGDGDGEGEGEGQGEGT